MKDHQWYFQKNVSIGKPESIGPMSMSQLQGFIQNGKLKKKDMVMSPTITKGSWVIANSLPAIGAVFERVSTQTRQDKAQKREAAQAKANAIRDEKQKVQLQRAAESRKRRDEIIASNRGTFFQKLFGNFKPSPYYGFDFQKGVIAICIVLVMIYAAGSTLFGLGGLAMAMSSEEAVYGPLEYAMMIGMLLLNIGLLFLVVVALVFFRNAIDWMIDMEEHAKETRELLKRH